MRLELSEERVLSSGSVLGVLFPLKSSERAAMALVSLFRSSGGYVSKEQMSAFARRLDVGREALGGEPVRYSRRNFYLTVMKRLVDMGFVQRNVRHRDPGTGEESYAYMRNIFDIPARPPAVGFWRLAYHLCRRWNELFE